MLTYSVYGNCQSGALAQILEKNDEFENKYIYKHTKFVHMIQMDKVNELEEVFKNSDLIIHQIIADTYKIPKASTSYLLQQRKKGSTNISFPSLYFNAYFPHLDNFDGNMSILDRVHDYIIMYAYVKGMNQKEVIELIQNDNLYTRDISASLLNQSFETLEKREKGLDIKVSEFIRRNYKDMKLFLLFNHPRGIVFDYIANEIFEMLKILKIEQSIDTTTSLDSGMITPIYKSTYKNLQLTFKEDFSTYRTNKGLLQQDQVVHEFFKTYNTFKREEILEAVKKKKPFIIQMFKDLDI